MVTGQTNWPMAELNGTSPVTIPKVFAKAKWQIELGKGIAFVAFQDLRFDNALIINDLIIDFVFNRRDLLAVCRLQHTCIFNNAFSFYFTRWNHIWISNF